MDRKSGNGILLLHVNFIDSRWLHHDRLLFEISSESNQTINVCHSVRMLIAADPEFNFFGWYIGYLSFVSIAMERRCVT